MQPVIPAPTRRSRPWLAALAGFLVAAVIFVVLVLVGVLRSNDSAPSAAPITMPRSIGNLARVQVVQQTVSNGKAIGPQLANERLSAVRTAAALSAAHDGAGAAVQVYVDPYLHTIYTVLAVRDATPPPVLGVYSPKLGNAFPRRIERVGSSYCEVDALQPSPVAVDISSCQRSSANLTVIVQSNTAHDARAVVTFVGQVWNAIS